jgi:probable phosphoglycerate mutase
MTAWTRERRFTGARDIPMTAAGHLQAEAAARALGAEQVVAVYASPLDRTRTTAEMIAKPHQLPVQIDHALVEMGFGRWEGRHREDIAVEEADAWRAWREAPHTLAAHGGEALTGVAARVADFTERMRVSHDGQAVVVVTHAIVIRLLVLSALGLGPERLWSVDASAAGISELELGTDWSTVHRMNTLTHLTWGSRDGVHTPPPSGRPGEPGASLYPADSK